MKPKLFNQRKKTKKIYKKIRLRTGVVIEHHDGTKYEVQKNGEWRKINVSSIRKNSPS